MIERLKQDNIYIGFAFGSLCILVTYAITAGLNELFFYSKQYYLLQPPKLQIVTLALNVLLFRYVMLKLKKFETGKGMLLAFFMTAVIYIIINRNII